MFYDQIREVACLQYVLFDDLGKALNPVSLETHPCFQCFEAALEFDSLLGKRQSAGDHSSGRASEIACGTRKGPTMHILVADQHAGNLKWQVHPLMQIEGNRIGELNAGDYWLQ